MDEVGPVTYFTMPALLWLAGTAMAAVGVNDIFHGVSFTVVGWHGYGRVRGP